MQGIFRAGLVAICLMLVLVQGVMASGISNTPAFSVSKVTIDPSGSLIADTPIVVSGTIFFVPSPGRTFPVAHDLHFVTDLDKVKWDCTLVLDSKEIPQSRVEGRTLSITGDVLSNPDTVGESVRFTLEGISPHVSQTRNITILRISEFDNTDEIAGSAVSYQVRVVFMDLHDNPQPSAETELEKFRSEIDAMAAKGIDTSLAEAKYSQADMEIKNAGGLPLDKRTQVNINLDTAQKAIDDGEQALDKAWAEKEVADAQVRVDKADTIIGWFKGNKSTADDWTLKSIIAKQEIAVSDLSIANENLANSNYAQARSKAHDAFLNSNDSYNAALSRKDQLVFSPCWGCGSVNIIKYVIPAAGIGVISILIAGIYWRRKHRK